MLKPSSSPLALTHTLIILLDQSDAAQALVTFSQAEVLEGYAAEMLRRDPPIHDVYREAKANETGSTPLSPGDLIYANIASASMSASPRVFCLDGSSYNRPGACVHVTHVDRSFSPQGASHPRGYLDQDPGYGADVQDCRQGPQGCFRAEERDPGNSNGNPSPS